MKKCSICKKSYSGFGNNAEPVNKGRCCDTCNKGVVIPIRLGQFIKQHEKCLEKINS